jgi:outer membrane receptor for ferric coprogen and ferric-rhodotorulic acid
LSLSIRETPQSVSVVSRQMMDDRGMQTTADALQSAPVLADAIRRRWRAGRQYSQDGCLA